MTHILSQYLVSCCMSWELRGVSYIDMYICSEFHLIGMYVDKHIVYYSCCVHPYPDITYYIHIKRRPMFYVFNMLLPCCLITLVALLGE